MFSNFSNQNYISAFKKLATFLLFVFVLLMPGVANASLLGGILDGATKTVRDTTGDAKGLVDKTTDGTPLAPIVDPVTKDVKKVVDQTTGAVDKTVGQTGKTVDTLVGSAGGTVGSLSVGGIGLSTTSSDGSGGAQNGTSTPADGQAAPATSTDFQVAASKGLATSVKSDEALHASANINTEAPGIPFAAKAFAFPIALSFLNWLYLSIQSHIDRKDPKLARVPEEKDLYFS